MLLMLFICIKCLSKGCLFGFLLFFAGKISSPKKNKVWKLPRYPHIKYYFGHVRKPEHYLYLRPFSIIIIYGKFSFNYEIFHFQILCFISCTSLVCKLCTFFQTIADLLAQVLLAVNQKSHVNQCQPSFTFSAVLLNQ